ncbi:hypothetical protein HCN44_002087 [Aphidius gifuensis]|uniref:Nuclear receptor domain-containing protein n=1 Tax=Aphidius gifuensis TaxID=684658 RepID=A0A835CXD7_APHGI|nr:putative uncharacterized protein DDB_G0285119 [Aphidius gifuensis]XP_044001050.1 putative uncharacterized protein DDB_G0285119 [Aphidius gifuensis]XP_044001052.1 putative uncharacterized protein DDB_G0285119 [Aphidius gifuensis]XP_044001053.1 putative uncharacterized protein DDB_G0285119 [Aphidius gifuensis]KAF7996455.1 hypothetical protein HCN44_002087 [Aphidius gifuensis]
MDVGELSNAAGLARSRTAVLGTATSTGNFIINNNNITNNQQNNLTNSYINSGWWTSASTLVTTPSNTDVMNQLCRVCGEPAAGFHFGAFTCEGCKSFFGRTYNNLGSISECKNGGVCIINKKNRTACKACRLRKCIGVGMSKSGSRYGRRSNWFKIHCLLQEQSHQAQQARLKNHSNNNKLPFDKIFNSHDTPNNNNNNININNNNTNNNSLATASGLNTVSMQQSRLYNKDDNNEIDTSRTSLLHNDILSHDLIRPELTRFTGWRAPPFFHPAINPMQLLNTPFFPFQQRFVVPFVNQTGIQIPITSPSSSSSDSITPRSTPSPKQSLNNNNNRSNNNNISNNNNNDDDDEDDENNEDNNDEDNDDEDEEDNDDNNLLKSKITTDINGKSIAYLRSLGPEQDEPMDLSAKSCEINDNSIGNNDNENINDIYIEKIEEDIDSNDEIEKEIGPPLDLTWKT